ncbi:MAG: hypothetical protein QCH99_03980 [Candidatus Bathyarchaeota archaeon]|nr:hypothetical protein [Candidatus Bathyarchaeum tardum]
MESQDIPQSDGAAEQEIMLLESALYVAGCPLDLRTLCNVLGIRSKDKALKTAQTLVEQYNAYNGSDVVGAKVCVNGTECVTNNSGWAGFNAFYVSAGKRVWTVTDLTHSTVTGYKVTAATPNVVWDSIVIDVEVSATAFGSMRFTVNVVSGYDCRSVTGAKVLANGETCTETKLGVYEIQLGSWNSIQQVTIVVERLDASTWFSGSFDNFSNIVLYVAVVATVIAISIIFWMHHKSKTIESK